MISGPELPARSGNTKQLVIILHGWGADGANLIDLAQPWSHALPDAHFCAPNAPFTCEANPFGFQWFSLADRSPARMLSGVTETSHYVNEFVDSKISELSAAAQPMNIALVGFSQGTMTALHVGLRRPDVACILGYSGALLDTPEMLKALNTTSTGNGKLPPSIPPASGVEASGPPICLIHGEQDDIVPFAAMAQAEHTLKAAGLAITTHARPNLPHSIDMEGVEIGGKFLLENLLGKNL